ncbi:MAG: hypothetical protein MRERV_3c046 [Mycoplasmataceae bacterium RV_VA103A]|nr:MAG: hypothetical protein MRERV_3c046 [Mycoplasmataceae bacterium RV_VA103A]
MKEKDNLQTEKENLEKELIRAETIIKCQIRADEIRERIKEIEEKQLTIHIQILQGGEVNIDGMRERERERESKNG